MKSFLCRFGSLLSFVLSGFDRLRFRGESRLLNNGRGIESYLYQRNLRCIDFPKHGEQLTQTLRRQHEQVNAPCLLAANASDISRLDACA